MKLEEEAKKFMERKCKDIPDELKKTIEEIEKMLDKLKKLLYSDSQVGRLIDSPLVMVSEGSTSVVVWCDQGEQLILFPLFYCLPFLSSLNLFSITFILENILYNCNVESSSISSVVRLPFKFSSSSAFFLVDPLVSAISIMYLAL